MTDSLPELLAPAGSLDALLAAVAAGADAVYCGLGAFNARASAADIEPATFERAVHLAHAHGVRVYVTCNVYLRERELDDALELARTAIAAGADALIVADAGFVETLRREIPGVEIHLSTQTGVMSAAGAACVARELRVERVTVSRELSLAEIADVAGAGLPVEVFCHGAICICYSGACAFSALRRGRSANRGDCTQPCRVPYDLQNGRGESLVPKDENRLLCPRDYCSIEHIGELVEAGVSALKIEGRMKNPDYVYNVVSTYRAALDAYAAGEYDPAFARACKRRLGFSFNRGFTDAYLLGTSGAELMSFERACNQGVAVGVLVGRGRDEVEVALDADVHAGDMFEIRSTPGPDAPKDVPKRWPQIPCPTDAPAGSRIMVHCKRKVEVESVVHCISSVDVLERSREAVARMRAEMDALEDVPVPETVPEAASQPRSLPADPCERAADAPSPLPAHLSVIARNAETAATLLADERVDRVLVRAAEVYENQPPWEDLLPGLTLVLDEPARLPDEATARELLEKAAGVVCRNYAHLERARNAGMPFDAAAPLSVTNGRSASWFAARGANCVWLPDELDPSEIVDAARSAQATGTVRLGVLAFGQAQLMVCQHCLLTAAGPCSGSCSHCRRRAERHVLVERDGSRLPVRVDVYGRTRIYDDAPLDRLAQVDELRAAGVSDFLIDAQLLDTSELERALDRLSAALAEPLL